MRLSPSGTRAEAVFAAPPVSIPAPIAAKLSRIVVTRVSLLAVGFA
jgi:hypothetical protein